MNQGLQLLQDAVSRPVGEKEDTPIGGTPLDRNVMHPTPSTLPPVHGAMLRENNASPQKSPCGGRVGLCGKNFANKCLSTHGEESELVTCCHSTVRSVGSAGEKCCPYSTCYTHRQMRRKLALPRNIISHIRDSVAVREKIWRHLTVPHAPETARSPLGESRQGWNGTALTKI